MIDPSLSRRLLQIAVGISAVQAILGGGLHLWLGLEGIATVARSPLEIDPADPSWARVDYMFRALAGIWLSLGLMFACIIPRIERHSLWFALCLVGIFGMGVGRLLSGLEYGPNPANSRGAMVAEFVLPPLLLLWQRSVAGNSA
jgi:hypothetical protein